MDFDLIQEEIIEDDFPEDDSILQWEDITPLPETETQVVSYNELFPGENELSQEDVVNIVNQALSENGYNPETEEGSQTFYVYNVSAAAPQEEETEETIAEETEAVTETEYLVDDILEEIKGLRTDVSEMKSNQIIAANNSVLQNQYLLAGVFGIFGGLAIGFALVHIKP